MLAHAFQNGAEVGQIAGDRKLIATLAVDLQRALRHGQRFFMAPLVPT